MNNLFTIVFESNEVFDGGISYFQTNWVKVPLDKKIRTLLIKLPLGDNLLLSGYDRYYYRVEACQDLYGKGAGQMKVEYIFVYGQKGNQVKMYRIDISTGNINVFINNKQDKEITRINPIYWR